MSRSLVSLAAMLAAAPLAIALGQQPPPPVFNGSQAATGESTAAYVGVITLQ